MTKRRKRWLVLVLLSLGTAFVNYSNIFLAARADDVMALYRCTAPQLAAIASISFLPGAVLSVPFGRWIDRVGSKKVLCVGFAAASVCLLLRIWVKTYWPLLSLTLIAGIFLVPTGVAPAKLLGEWFSSKEMPVAFGLYGSSAGLGAAIGFATGNLFPSVRAAFLVIAVLPLLLSGAWLLSGELAAPGAVNGSAPAVGGMPSVLRSRNLWKVAVCAFIASGVSLVLNTYLTRALTVKGALPSAAAAIGTILNLSMIAGGVLGGGLTANVGRYTRLFLVLCVSGGALLLAAWFVPFGTFTYLTFPLAALVLSGAVCLNMAKISLLPLIGEYKPEEVATANGVSNMCMSFGSFLLPVLVSAVAGERYPLVFLLAAGAFSAAGILGNWMPELGGVPDHGTFSAGN